MKFFQQPIRTLLLLLGLLSIFATISWCGTSLPLWFAAVRNLVLLWASGWTLNRFLLWRKIAKPSRFEHRLITVAILFLLFDPTVSWWVFPLLGLTAELGQRLLRFPTGPMVNPAGLAAVLISFFGYYPSWWGASFSPRFPIIEGGVSTAVVLTLVLGIFVALKYRKHLISVTSALVFGGVYWFISQRNPLFILIEGTLLFFLLIMATEPKTSPVVQKQQLIFGAALGVTVVIAQKIYFPEPYAGALVLCNFIFNLHRNKNWVFKSMNSSPTPNQT